MIISLIRSMSKTKIKTAIYSVPSMMMMDWPHCPSCSTTFTADSKKPPWMSWSAVRGSFVRRLPLSMNPPQSRPLVTQSTVSSSTIKPPNKESIQPNHHFCVVFHADLWILSNWWTTNKAADPTWQPGWKEARNGRLVQSPTRDASWNPSPSRSSSRNPSEIEPTFVSSTAGDSNTGKMFGSPTLDVNIKSLFNLIYLLNLIYTALISSLYVLESNGKCLLQNMLCTIQGLSYEQDHHQTIYKPNRVAYKTKTNIVKKKKVLVATSVFFYLGWLHII